VFGSLTNKLLAVVAAFALSSAVVAQEASQAIAEDPVENPVRPMGQTESPRLINPDEGMAIIGAALEIRYRRHEHEDCSHLVHDIYRQAGFPYRYADSRELYEGIEAFREVMRPQPGDLAVWPGHAAIMVNPVQHSFFSATRSGLRVESYDLKYWKRRGTPRFFRYQTSDPPTLFLARTVGSGPSPLRKLQSHPVQSKTPKMAKSDSTHTPN
jgi:hypothetical protein